MIQNTAAMNRQKIKVSIASNNLPASVKEEMWAIYRHYYHYTREEFFQRFQKNNFYSFYTLEGKIVGFTGLRIDRIDGKLLVYFGQTVIDESSRGNFLIPRTALRLFARYWKDMLLSKMYFWADNLTYKAYLVFAKNLEEFYPSYQEETPAPVNRLIDQIGEKYYPETFCPETKTVRKDAVLVNDINTVIAPKYLADPDIRFFTLANPRYDRGHGLITIGPMHLQNVVGVIKKSIAKKFKRKEQPRWRTVLRSAA